MAKIFVRGNGGSIGIHVVDQSLLQVHGAVLVDDLATGRESNPSLSPISYQIERSA